MLPLLLSLLATPTANAAQCCGWFNNLQETQLWQAREKLCSNVWSNQWIDGGYIAKVTVEPRYWTTVEYAFWAKSDTGSFSECWDATEQIITQCARNKHSVGTWEAYGQTYAMSAAQLSYKSGRRSLEDAKPLPEFEVTGATAVNASNNADLSLDSLVDGLYEVDGVPVEIHFEGLGEYGLATRDLSDHTLVTSKGPTTDWNVTVTRTVKLGDEIARVVRRRHKRSEGLEKRRQACEVASHSYVMLQIGEWQDRWEASSDTMMCGQNGGCAQTKGWSKTTSESFSIGLSAGIKNDIANAAISFGYSWTRSWTRSISSQCTWITGEPTPPSALTQLQASAMSGSQPRR